MSARGMSHTIRYLQIFALIHHIVKKYTSFRENDISRSSLMFPGRYIKYAYLRSSSIVSLIHIDMNSVDSFSTIIGACGKLAVTNDVHNRINIIFSKLDQFDFSIGKFKLRFNTN